MSLEGLRAWIGEVERKLGMRTRVFLALSVIAIGISGAALYLAIDARDNSVSKDDVLSVQQELGTQSETSASAPEVTRLEAEVAALQSEVEQLKGGGAQSQDEGGGDSGSGGITPDGTGSALPGGTPDSARIKELLEQAQKQSEEAK